MLAGVIAALGAGLLWGLVVVVPLVLHDYPGVVLAAGRHLAFAAVALPLAWIDRRRLAGLTRADWIEASALALAGNLVYYAAVATALQFSGAQLPTLLIGSLPVLIAITANLLEGRKPGAGESLAWRSLALPLTVMLAGLALVHAHPPEAGEAGAARGERYYLGLALTGLALVCWTWYPLRNSRWLARQPAEMARPWATAQGLATLPLAAAGLLGYYLWETLAASRPAFEWPAGPRPLLFLTLMLTVGPSASWLATLLWNRASQCLPPALAGQLIVFDTLAGLAYAFLWYRRWPSAAEAAGMCLLVAGVLLALQAFRGLKAR